MLAGLIPIHLHLNKFSRGHHLRVISLSQQHAFNFLLDEHHSKKTKPHCLSIVLLTQKHCSKIKSSIVNSNNCLNEVFSLFDKLHKELSLDFHLVDTFPDCFFFYIVNYKDMEANNAHQKKLNKIINDSISNPNTVIVISSDSIKNNVTTSILHVYNGWNIIAKTIHYTMNITFTEIELFSIRCEINQAVQVSNIEQIIVITDTIPAARYIFNLFTYSYQLHFISVFQDLRAFFNKNSNYFILF